MKNNLSISFLLFFVFTLSLDAQIINGNFDLGPNSGWTVYSSNNATIIGTAANFYSPDIQPPVNTMSGLYMARLGGFSYAVNSIKQTVTLPNTSPLYLHTYVQSRSFSGTECSGLYVGARIRVYFTWSQGTQTLYDTYLCYYNDLHNWTFLYFDISAAQGQTVEIKIQADAANTMWSFLYLDDLSISNSPISVKPISAEIPNSFSLSQNFPNPFNPTTNIKFDLPNTSTVKLIVYDALGKEAAVLVNEELKAGSYQADWDGSNFASGFYYYRLTAGDFVDQKKMILLK